MNSLIVRRVAFSSVLLHSADSVSQKLVLCDMVAKFSYHLVTRNLTEGHQEGSSG